MDSDSDELAELLRAAADEGELIFNENVAPNSNSTQQPNTQVSKNEESKSVVPNGKDAQIKLAEDANDSSDEEDLQNFFERKYHEYGRDINQMLKRKDAERKDTIVGNEVANNLRKSIYTKSQSSSTPSTAVNRPQPLVQPPPKPENVYTDPVFGIRIVQPLISSTMLRERMVGRTPVEIRYLQNHLMNSDLSKEWCISGVIVSKGPAQTSNAGSQYVIWRLSDLKGEIKTTSLFLFKSAFKELWKTAQGMVIAILNPSVFSRKDNNGESSLSIDSAQRVMILGKSKDFGTCKSKKKNGDPCTSVVNLNVCEYCVYHVKQEYGKFTTRSELQSATSGRGLQSLRNKVLGKSEVFYAGKSYMAEPSKPSKRVTEKDRSRLMTLSETFLSSPLSKSMIGKSLRIHKISNAAFSNRLFHFRFLIAGNKPNYLGGTNNRSSRIAEGIESTSSQRAKDLERLKALKGTMPSTTSSQPTTPIVEKPKIDLDKFPSLSRNSFSFSLSSGSPQNRNDSAKIKAAAILQKKPIEKSNPNFIKYRGTESGKKRALEAIEADATDENAQKKKKLAEEVEKFKNEKIQQLVAAKSSHADLVKLHEANVEEQYFNKLEKKEAMEQKMVNTSKVDCKAVICLKCKYKAFSAAQRCKDEKHQLKVIDAEKRFFECEECKNRTISLFKIPKTSCSNCQGSRWKRTGMIRDKSELSRAELSIRGDEETFMGSLSTKSNLNLCVAAE